MKRHKTSKWSFKADGHGVDVEHDTEEPGWLKIWYRLHDDQIRFHELPVGPLREILEEVAAETDKVGGQ